MRSYFAILRLFEFLGLTKSASNPSQVSYRMYLNSLLWTIIIVLYFQYISSADIFHVGSIIGRILDTTQLVIPLINHLLIIFETVRLHKVDYKIRTTVETLEGVANVFLCGQSSQELSVYFTKLCFGVLGSGFLSEVFIIAASYKYDVKWTKSWLVRFLPNQMIRISLAHYLFYVAYMTDKLEKMRRELESSAQQAEIAAEGGKSDQVIFRRIRRVGRAHQLIRALRFHVEHRFGFMIVSTMVNYFMCSTVCWYYVASRIYYGVYQGLIESCLGTVPLLSCMIGVAWSCAHCTNASFSLGSALHTIRTNNARIMSLIRCISTQFVGMEMTAGNFFTINFSMLKSMVFSISTYIVVFISMNQQEGKY